MKNFLLFAPRAFWRVKYSPRAPWSVWGGAGAGLELFAEETFLFSFFECLLLLVVVRVTMHLALLRWL